MELLLWQFVKFCLVGSLGLIIDFSLTFFLKEKIFINKYLAHSSGFTVAVISNFIFNKYWTFRDKNSDVLFQGGKFVIIALIGLYISNQLIYLLNDRKNLNFYVSKFLAIVVVVIWNFTANYFFTFSV